MALNDPYATVPEYRADVTKSSGGSDTVLAAQLQGASDHLSLRLRRRFGLAAAPNAYLLDGNGEVLLWLAGSVPDIANLTGLVVKVDADGDYTPELTLVKDTDYWLEPATPEPGWPYEALRVHPSSAQVSEWPEGPRTIEVTATWGWPAVPDMIKRLTIMTVRNMRDMLESGSTLAVSSFDAAIQFTPDTQRLWLEVIRMYARPTGFS